MAGAVGCLLNIFRRGLLCAAASGRWGNGVKTGCVATLGQVVAAQAGRIENRCAEAHLKNMMYTVHHMKPFLRFKGPLLNRG